MSVLMEAGAELLDETSDFISRFIAFPDDHCLTAVTLWAAHCHLIESFYTTPRLALLSPEAGSGKTRVLEVLEPLVPNPMMSLSASPAAVFRTLADRQITLLFDECDTIFTKRGKDDNNEDLRALLNAGYRRGARIPRCVGPKHEVVEFPVFCTTALAGIGTLPDTILSRSIIIKMRRRAPTEHVEQFRERWHHPEGHELRDRLALWADSVKALIADADPAMPAGVTDRPAECWEPLLIVADAAGDHWPATARGACVTLVAVAQDRRVSLGIRLLADLRQIFRDEDAMHGDTIIERLCDQDSNELAADAPWSELHGKGLSRRGLANMLSNYGIHSKPVRIGEKVQRGYRREDLWDAWSRYLPPVPVQPLQALQPAQKGGNGANPVTDVTLVTHVHPGERASGARVPGEDDDLPF